VLLASALRRSWVVRGVEGLDVGERERKREKNRLRQVSGYVVTFFGITYLLFVKK
jgi:hypothetical protein